MIWVCLGVLASVGLACGGGGGRGLEDAGDASLDAGDAATLDGSVDRCACLPGAHTDHIFLMSQDGEVYSFDPVTLTADFVFGPVCGGITPFSMAVDARGVAWINDSDSLSVQTLDLLHPGACQPSPYLRRDMRYGLFGMSFATESLSDTCADLYLFTYDGMGAFTEGLGQGLLGVVDPGTGELREIAVTDFNGGELSGTGDGRLFALTGVEPAKLVEYDKHTGAVLETIPLDGFSTTNASAMAFYSGDLYLFTEATPAGCVDCLTSTCATDYDSCQLDSVCSSQLSCTIEQASFRDDCGGLMPMPVVDCLMSCTDTCYTPLRSRVSQVTRLDLDGSDGSPRALTRVVDALPIRVVGAASSPCVPVGPI